jgi:hypothetical protein
VPHNRYKPIPEFPFMSDPQNRRSLLQTLTSSRALMVAIPVVLITGAVIGIGRSVARYTLLPRR